MPRLRLRPPVRFEEDKRVWESGMHTEVLEFQGSLHPKEFVNWLCLAKEVIKFKEVPKEMKVPLIAIRLRGRATTWWQ